MTAIGPKSDSTQSGDLEKNIREHYGLTEDDVQLLKRDGEFWQYAQSSMATTTSTRVLTSELLTHAKALELLIQKSTGK